MVSLSFRLGAALLAVAGSGMAQLQHVNNFGNTYNTQLSMDIYVPSSKGTSPAVILAVSFSRSLCPRHSGLTPEQPGPRRR